MTYFCTTKIVLKIRSCFLAKNSILKRVVLSVFLFSLHSQFSAQQVPYYFQGFENFNVPTCPENLSYNGGVRTLETAKTGTYALRLGRSGESNTVTFGTINTTGLSNPTLRVSHRIIGGAGPGIDVREGAAFLISLDGGAVTMISGISGYSDYNYPWTATTAGSASTSAGCTVYQSANVWTYAIPAGTTNVTLKIITVGRGNSNCATFNADMNAGIASNFDRSDEAIFLDDIELLADAPSVSNNGIACSNSPLQLFTTNVPASLGFQWSGPLNFSSTQQNPLVALSPSSSMSGTYSNTISANTCPVATLTTVANVGVPVNPTFSFATTQCSGTNFTLPTTSNNGIAGTWSPSFNNQNTGDYTFTPNAGICANTYTATIQITQSITPTFNVVNPICAGDNLASLPTTSLNNISGSWSPAINNQSTTTYTFTPSGGQCVQTATMTISVNQNATPTFQSVGPYCQGAVIPDLPTTSLNAISGSWSPALNNQNTSTYTFTPNAGICALPVTTTITISPAASITLNAVSICSGQSTTLSPTTSPSGGNYIWSDNSTNSSLTVAPNSTSNYSVTYSAGACTVTSNATVTVNPTPTVQLSGVTICSGSVAQLTPIVSISGGTYSWSEGSTSSSISTSTAGNYTLSYTVSGCTGIGTTSVVVNPIPSIQTGNYSVCAGQTLTLNPTISSSGGTYLWSNNATSSQINVTPTLTSDYTLTYTLNGCTSTQTFPVTVVPIPIVDFSADKTGGCAPLTVNFQGISTSGGTVQQALWQVNGSGNYTSLSDFSFPFQQPGCYSISLSLTVNGCTNTISRPDFICVDVTPQAAFSPSVFSFTEPNGSVSFMNSSYGATNYSWFANGTNFSTDLNPTYFVNNAMAGLEVVLVASTAQGCSDSTSIFIPYEESTIFYIPNSFTPDGDEFNNVFLPVFTSGFDSYNYRFLVFNRWGELLFESLHPEKGWDGSYGTDGRKCQSETYTYWIEYKIPSSDARKRISGNVNLIR